MQTLFLVQSVLLLQVLLLEQSLLLVHSAVLVRKTIFFVQCTFLGRATGGTSLQESLRPYVHNKFFKTNIRRLLDHIGTLMLHGR